VDKKVFAPLCRIDKDTYRDPNHVSEFVDDIMTHMFATESLYSARFGYMLKQKEFTEKMRFILVDWLIEVHHKFKLRDETLFITVSLLDRYLQLFSVPKKNIQLLSVACLLIACKYEEIYPPTMKDFVFISEKKYTSEMIIRMEEQVLMAVDFNVQTQSPARFLDRFCKIARADQETTFTALYLLDCLMLSYNSLQFLPSLQAASALYLAERLQGIDFQWTSLFVKHTRYDKE
jgi:cyclin B